MKRVFLVICIAFGLSAIVLSSGCKSEPGEVEVKPPTKEETVDNAKVGELPK